MLTLYEVKCLCNIIIMSYNDVFIDTEPIVLVDSERSSRY